MLFELRPDLFPSHSLTDAELILWGRYFESQKSRRTHGAGAAHG